MHEPEYAVLSPLGAARARGAGTLRQPSLQSLGQAVVAEVWDYRFRGDEIYAALREVLAPANPGIRFVGSEVFGDVHGTDAEAKVAALPARLEEHGCNAVLVGVGA